MNFRIPEIRMPSEDELQTSTRKWEERIGKLLIDQWPADLLALSAPTTFIEFPLSLAEQWGHEEQRGWSSEADRVAAEIDRACGWSMKFFRLNSRSPKDAPWPLEALVTCSGKHVLHCMRGSERMLDDLCYFKRSAFTPMICLRDVMYGCRPDSELRCFLVDGHIKAVAEYGHTPTLALSPDGDTDLRARVDRYLLDVVGPHLPTETIVVDLLIDGSDFRLIEVNPFGLSDPVGAGSYDVIMRGIPGIARHSPRRGHDR